MLSLVARAVAALTVVTAGLMASHTPASALIHTCTNKEIRTIVTDAFIISCTGVGGTVKYSSSGKQTCCKKVDGYDICSPNPSDLSSIRPPPPYSRPPHVRTDPGPGRVSPPQNPIRPPRADPPPSRIGPPASTGPRVK
jgi:hypothetical protein